MKTKNKLKITVTIAIIIDIIFLLILYWASMKEPSQSMDDIWEKSCLILFLSLFATYLLVDELGINCPKCHKKIFFCKQDHNVCSKCKTDYYIDNKERIISSGLKEILDSIEQMVISNDVEGVIKALDDENEIIHEAAVIALAKIGKPAVEPLIKALKDKDPVVRGAAAEALGKIRDPIAVEPLIKALDEENWSSRNNVVEALGNYTHDTKVVKPLIQALKGDNWKVWWSKTFRAVKEVDRPTAFRLLLKECENNDAKTVKKIKKVLKKLQNFSCPGCGKQVDLIENHEYCPFCELKFERSGEE